MTMSRVSTNQGREAVAAVGGGHLMVTENLSKVDITLGECYEIWYTTFTSPWDQETPLSLAC